VTFVLCLAAAYLIGAIPVAYITGKWIAGIDLRAHGSGNLGATNLYRVLGLKYALPAALLDIAKGAVPVLVLPRWINDAPVGEQWVPAAVGLAAIVGHVFPVYLGFRGGKGVATAAGVILVIAPLPLLVSAAVWGVLLFSTRIMSVASVGGAVSFPVAARLLMPSQPMILGIGLFIAAFIVWNHRANLGRLRSGTEAKIGRSGAGSTKD
jgi:acyl phosphate:glycerol-3-phosphate acyltransferase